MAANKKILRSYGGQALIEGVLMRGKHGLAAALRAPDGNIIIKTERLKGIYKSRIINIPFLRGLVLLWDALGLGIRYLTISANLQTQEEEKIEGPALVLAFGSSFAIAIVLFFISPALIGQWATDFFNLTAFGGNLLEGFIRLLLVIGYIWAIGRMQEIRMVFSYHGAEHKTINAFEAGSELSPENVAKYSVEHPRCGTAFTLTLVLISILLFTLLGPLPILWRIISRVALIPILAGIAYEYIRWTGNNLNKPIIRSLIRPNLALQKLTTREPSYKMLEISIAAFKAMLQQEKKFEETDTTRQSPEQQPSDDEDEYRSQRE